MAEAELALRAAVRPTAIRPNRLADFLKVCYGNTQPTARQLAGGQCAGGDPSANGPVADAHQRGGDVTLT